MKKTIQLKESDITRMVMEAVNELTNNDIAAINGPCGDDENDFIEYLQELGLRDGDAMIYRGFANCSGNWGHGIILLKRAGAWNEQTASEYREMIERWFDNAKICYQSAISAFEDYSKQDIKPRT